MSDQITHKQVADALLSAYKNHKVDIRTAFYNPAFSNLPLHHKVELVKKYAEVHNDPERGLPKGGATSIALKTLEGAVGGGLGTFMAVGVGSALKNSLTNANYSKEMADKIFDRALALSAPMAGLTAVGAGIREFGNQRHKAKKRDDLRKSLEDINNSKDESERTHRALMFLARLPTSAPEERKKFSPFMENVKPIAVMQKAVMPEKTASVSLSTIRKLVKDQ